MCSHMNANGAATGRHQTSIRPLRTRGGKIEAGTKSTSEMAICTYASHILQVSGIHDFARASETGISGCRHTGRNASNAAVSAGSPHQQPSLRWAESSDLAS